MEDQSQKPITNEMFYVVQKSVADNISSLREHADENYNLLKEILLRVEEQTKKTNGRVSKLEEWRSWVIGGLACGSIILGVIIGLVCYIWITQVKSIEAKENEIASQLETHINK